MPKQDYERYLKVQDAVEVMRALSDIRDLKAAPTLQRDLLTHTAITLFDARQGFTVAFNNLTPEGNATPSDVVAQAASPDALEEFLNAWATLPPMDFREDPLVDNAARAHHQETVQLTGRTFDYDRFTNNTLYQTFAGPIGMRSVLASTFDVSPPGTPLGTRALGLSIHRMVDQKPFNERELARLELFNHELRRLASLGDLPCAHPPPNQLTPRQRQIGRLLLEGLGAKQIARELRLSTHTVYTYCKDLYRRIHVADRMEATRRFHEDPSLLEDPARVRIRVDHAQSSRNTP